MKSRCLLIAALLPACRGDPAPAAAEAGTAWLVVRAASDAVDWRTLRVEPADRIETTSRQGSTVVLAVRGGRAAGEVRLDVDGACSLVVPVAELPAGAVVERRLSPWLDFGGPRVGVGFDTPVAVQVTPGCPEAAAGRIDWRQSGGAPVPMQGDARGFKLQLRTPTAQQALGATLPWGIVPISPRTRAELLFEAVWRGPRPNGGVRSQRFQLEISAAHRSRGLPNVALGTSLLLAPEGWRVVEAPADARAVPRSASGFSIFEPDRHGRWLLEDSQRRRLSIHAARYDHTPLDCGRGGCHGPIAQAASKTPMTSILRREIEREHPDYPGCALGCHTTGERGAEDGGFSHVAAEIGLNAADLEAGPGRWEALPRPLRRLGGVSCLACHGPAAIPEPSARAAILRSDVCAYCHDAPPRYGHVEAWRTNAMARADRDPVASTDARCVRCHTTSGFLAHQAARTGAPADPDSTRINGPIGVSCAACHAVHDPGAGPGTQPALLRSVRMPTLLSSQPVDPKSRVCTPCHTPSVDEAAPSASAAALLLGRGGVDPSSGSALEGPAPHSGLEGGCLACHSYGPSTLERGGGHAFRASRETCKGCHQPSKDARTELKTRAEGLWAKLLPRLPAGSKLVPSRPPHAAPPKWNPKTPLGRAATNVLLVLEDPAAAEHNLPYARKLLDSAERWIE